MLPHFAKDNTDRNRTSPFAFTGNKFEFRMLGSAASVANPNIVLNTAVAEALDQFAKELDGVAPEDMEHAVHELIKRAIKKHKRVIFNGNGYTDEWIEEAEKRRLYRHRSLPRMLSQCGLPRRISTCSQSTAFSPRAKSCTPVMKSGLRTTPRPSTSNLIQWLKWFRKTFLPSVMSYTEEIASTASLKASVVPGITCESETALITKLYRTSGCYDKRS